MKLNLNDLTRRFLLGEGTTKPSVRAYVESVIRILDEVRPKSQRENVKNELRIKELEEELEFYKSIFKTHRNSAVFNLRIKTINGEKIWIDKIKISTEYNLLNSLDEDDEVREWKTPVRCSGWYD